MLLILKLFFLAIAVSFSSAGAQENTYCCNGPPNAFANPLTAQAIEKVTISVTNTTASVAFYKTLFNYELQQNTFNTPFGNVTRIAFNNSVVIEFIERENSVPGVQRPAPFNQTFYTGICQYSYRVKDYTRVSAWLAENGVNQIIEPFYNEQLQLWLQMIYDNSTNLIIEFLQPYDNSSFVVDYNTNPMGIMGFNQVTQGVYNFFDVIDWYSDNFGTILPYNSVSNFTNTSFKTVVGLSELENVLFEMIYEIGSYANPYPSPNPPNQGHYQGYVSWAMRVQDIEQTQAWLQEKNIDILYYYNSTSWGGYSIWIRDNNDVLVEFFQPASAPHETMSSSCSSSNEMNAVEITLLVLFLISSSALILVSYGYWRGYIVFYYSNNRKFGFNDGNSTNTSSNPMQA